MSVRLGILGFAHAHVGMYCAEWRKRDDMQFVAGWDHDVARAQKSGIAVAVSVADVLARVDAVAIGAETSRHAELVEQAAAAGKAIVLQKPLALTLPEADCGSSEKGRRAVHTGVADARGSAKFADETIAA
jgi:predicted dehydrogenase